MGFKLITRDEIFYPADYGLKVGDELNVVLTGGGGSVMAFSQYTDTTDTASNNAKYYLFPTFEHANTVSASGDIPGFADRADLAPSATIFGSYGSAKGGANSRSSSGGRSGFADGGPTDASGAVGGGGGWLPGVSEFGGNGGAASTLTSDSTFVMADGGAGLAGEGTTTSNNVFRPNRNKYGGQVIGSTPTPALGMSKAECVNKFLRICNISKVRTGSGAGAGFGSGAGAIRALRGSAAGAETKFISHRITEEDIANGIPVRIGRPGAFHCSRFLTKKPNIYAQSSSYQNCAYLAINSAYADGQTLAAGHIFGTDSRKMDLPVPANGPNTNTRAVATHGHSVLYSANYSESYASNQKIIYIPDVRSMADHFVYDMQSLLGLSFSGSNSACYPRRLKYLNGKWIMLLSSSSLSTNDYAVYAFTDDPAGEWTLMRGSGNYLPNLYDVEYFNGKYVFQCDSGSDATNCLYTTPDLGVLPTPATGITFSSTSAGYYPNRGYTQFVKTDDGLYLTSIYYTSNRGYLSAWYTTDLTSWNQFAKCVSLTGSYGSGQIYIHDRDLFYVGSASNYCYASQIRFENGSYTQMKTFNAVAPAYYHDRPLTFVVRGDRIYALPEGACTTYRNHMVCSIPLDATSTASWSNIPGATYSANFFLTTGYVPSGLIAFVDDVLYFSVKEPGQYGYHVYDKYYDYSQGDGWFEVHIDDVMSEYPESFSVRGRKSAEDCYQEDWANCLHIMSGADGCCEIFW